MTDPTLPLVTPPESGRRQTRTVWGILLAAGTSTRYGPRNKLLAEVENQQETDLDTGGIDEDRTVTMVRQAAQPLIEADLSGVVAVVGYEAPAVRAALSGLEIDIHENDRYEEGQSTSVRAGVAYAQDKGADAVVLSLADMPAVTTQTVQDLVATYEVEGHSALAAAVEGQRGNPVLFDAQHFDALTSVSGDVGGREILLSAGDGALLETGDPGVRIDVDEPEDLPPTGEN